MPMILLILLVLAMCGPISGAWAHSEGDAGQTTSKRADVAPDRRAREATLSLLDAKKRHSKAPAAERGRRLAELLEVAKRRHDELTALVDSDPAEMLRVALPDDLRAGLPEEVEPFVEQSVDETGDLEVLHVDHVDSSRDFYIHSLKTPKGKFSLHFAGKAPHLATGAKVRVRGKKLDDAIVVAAAGDVTPILIGAPLSNTLGVQKTLAILVNFSNAPSQPFSAAYAQGMMFGTTSDYDYEVSYQQTSLAGAVAGWFTISESSTSCNYTNIATKAKQAAAAAGHVLAYYTRFVYVFPANSCEWWGLGSVGGNPSQSWIHAKWGFTLPVIGHEMGHNFGLYHSHSLDCGTAAIAGSGCVSSDYGDIFDTMGSSNAGPHFNAFQKERLGWLNSGVSPPITTVPAVTGTGNYTIAPIEDTRNQVPRALKIPRGTSCTASNEWFYVESRQAKGFDSFLADNANVLGGVLVHKVTGGDADSSYLLDMTPQTLAWSDAALVAGQTFTDPQSRLTITPLSVGSSSSTIAVAFPPVGCTRVAPTVTLTPAATVYTAAGASVSYTVAVRNNDGCGCAASNFDVSAEVPAGWSATSARTAGVAPAGSSSVSVLITTAAAATVAFHPVTLMAANATAPASTGLAGGTIAVTTTPTTTTALGVNVTADNSTYKMPRSKATIYASIATGVSGGSAPVAGAAVSVKVTDPAGAVTTLTGTTDGTGTAKVSYPITAGVAKKGKYAVTSVATMGSTSATAATSFVVK